MNRPLSRNRTTRKERYGRWSPAQANLFEELIQRYGKNWKKIHEHMKGRSLSQIRSHAQKFFDKIGSKKVQEYERRAKLLEALEILEKEKRLAKDAEKLSGSEESKREPEVPERIGEASSSADAREEQSLTSLHAQVKEAQPQGEIKKEEEGPIKLRGDGTHANVPYLMPQVTGQNGFLINLIYTNPDAFSQYGLGLQRFLSGVPSNPFYFQGR